MDFQNPWDTGFGCSRDENIRLKKYLEKNRNLAFAEFNTTHGLEGSKRALDAILFPGLEGHTYKSRGNYENIKKLIEDHPVELIEVHGWGFYVLGQLIGKEHIVQKYWNPLETQKVLLTMDSKKYHPKKSPDKPTQEVFEKYGVEVYVP